jgi:hypothetical protein
MTGVLKMTDELEAEMPTMLSEHKDIAASLRKLSDAAKAEGKPQGMQFAEMLTAHALGEEEITYPTALLAAPAPEPRERSAASGTVPAT